MAGGFGYWPAPNTCMGNRMHFHRPELGFVVKNGGFGKPRLFEKLSSGVKAQQVWLYVLDVGCKIRQHSADSCTLLWNQIQINMLRFWHGIWLDGFVSRVLGDGEEVPCGCRCSIEK